MKAKTNNKGLWLLLRDEGWLASLHTLRSGLWSLCLLGSMILRHHRSQNQQGGVAQMKDKTNHEGLWLLLRDEGWLAGFHILRSGRWPLGSLGSMILKHHPNQNQQGGVAQMKAKTNNEGLWLLLRDEGWLAGLQTLRPSRWSLGSLGSMILRHHRSQNQQPWGCCPNEG